MENVPLVVAERAKNLNGITIKKAGCADNSTNNRKTLLEEKEKLLKRLEEIEILLNK